jgi:hypothetical protein
VCKFLLVFDLWFYLLLLMSSFHCVVILFASCNVDGGVCIVSVGFCRYHLWYPAAIVYGIVFIPLYFT